MEDEVAVYCKLAEQSIFEAINLRNEKKFESIAKESMQKLGEMSSQSKLIFMSQKTVNKMQDRAMLTQDKSMEIRLTQ